MARLFRSRSEKRTSLWQKAVRLAMTDVRVLVRGLDEESLETLEERLIAADFGVPATLRLIDHLEGKGRREGTRDGGRLRSDLRAELERILTEDRPAGPEGGRGGGGAGTLLIADAPPTVYLIAGVNGVGKTTTVAKLAHTLSGAGHTVVLAAGDTYRAGAVDQLRMWADRIGVDFVAGQSGGDPAAVAFDAIQAARSRGADMVLVDTAGRLHTDRNLMDEIAKVRRVIEKQVPGAPHETLLVVDATTGQNAVRQAAAFDERVPLTGVILAKMDSTARGGIVVALREELGLDVRFVGTGEGLGDLEPFSVDAFIDGVFAEEEV